MKVTKYLIKIKNAYEELAEANSNFAEKELIDSQALNELIKKRDVIIDDIEWLFIELCKSIRNNYIDQPFKCRNLPEALRALPVIDPLMQQHCAEIKSALQKLVESDKKIEEAVQKQKQTFQIEINKLRRTHKNLAGYKQGAPIGSAFIDKKK